jgi:hypothetical protein
MPRSFFAPLFTLLIGMGTADAQLITIAPNEANFGCTAAEVGSTPWIELHVIASVYPDDKLSGFHGAQFRVTGMPDTWNESNVIWSLDTSVTLGVGNPLFSARSPAPWDDASGTTVAWNTCQDQLTQRIGKIILLGAPTGENITLRITPFRLHLQEDYCVMMNACDAPYFTKTCVKGGSFTLNGQGSSKCIITAVQETSWSAVKSLYQ